MNNRGYQVLADWSVICFRKYIFKIRLEMVKELTANTNQHHEFSTLILMLTFIRIDLQVVSSKLKIICGYDSDKMTLN